MLPQTDGRLFFPGRLQRPPNLFRFGIVGSTSQVSWAPRQTFLAEDLTPHSNTTKELNRTWLSKHNRPVASCAPISPQLQENKYIIKFLAELNDAGCSEGLAYLRDNRSKRDISRCLNFKEVRNSHVVLYQVIDGFF